MRFKFAVYSKQMKTIETEHVLKLFLLIMQIIFLMQDNVILLRLESLKEWLVFHELRCTFKCKQETYFFFNV